MSIYTVISNSYNDLLNSLADENKSNTDGLKAMFSNISDDKKRQLVIKLADMMVLIHTTFDSEIVYWDSIRRQHRLFFWGYIVASIIIVIVISFIGLYFILRQLKKDKNMFSIVKIIIRIVLIFHVVICIMIIMMLNSSITIKYTKGQIELLNDDFESYGNYVFQGATKDEMYKLFLFVGYYRKKTVSKYRFFYNQLQKNGSYNGVLALYDINSDKVTEENRKTSIEVQLYNMLKSDIDNSLIQFYNGGEGYTNVKKRIMMSSPVRMLKEVQSIMNYYTLYGYKKHPMIVETIKETDEKAINEIITKPILNLIDDISDNIEPKENDVNAAVLLNEKNEQFKLYYKRLLEAFYYTAVFVYPISIGILPDDPSFTPKSLIALMPYSIKPNSNDENEMKYQRYLRDFFFNVKADSDYVKFVKSTKVENNIFPAHETIKELCEKLKPFFYDVYFKLFYHMKGSIKYPLMKNFIINAMMRNFSISPTNVLPNDYLIMISDVIFENIVQPVGASLNILQIQQGYLIDKISKTLSETNIDLVRYQNQIIVAISQSSPKGKSHVDEVTKILDQINQRTIVERQFKNKSNVASKFNTLDDFVKVIDDVNFESFINGFKIEYFKDVIDKFYKNINDSVSSKMANQRNIYYYRQRGFSIFKSSISMIIVAMVILYLIYAIHVVSDFNNIKKRETAESECDIKFINREYFNNLANWVIRLVLPLLILMIGIVLLISVYKNNKSKFDFNLEIIETNTNGLKTALNDYAIILEDLKKKLDVEDITKNIGLIDKITSDDKKAILNNLIVIIDKYDKCNYIVEAGNKTVPFPYTELIIYGFMLMVGLGCILYVLFVFKPFEKIINIKMLNKLKEQVYTTRDLNSITERIKGLSICHNEDTDAVILSIKMIFIIFITMFMVFYSAKIVGESNDFKKGLYNSSYYNESKCYGT